MSDPEIIAFPLESDVQEIELENLAKGWYLVCGEAVKKDVVLERQCFWAKILKEPASTDNTGETKWKLSTKMQDLLIVCPFQ